MHKSIPTSLALLALVALPACLSGSGRIDRLYESLAREVSSTDPVRLPNAQTDARHHERADLVHEIYKEGGIKSAQDAFKAAVILVGTQRAADLQLAEELALRSAEMGEPRGMRVAAEAIDKRLMIAGHPQMYGTQYVFEFVLDSWRLYPIDPTTTDEDRAVMSVPTYAELLASEDAMNRAHKKKLRGQ
ncbi:MAG: hypothetical protein JNL28_15565 [Planctomycetes bacterium]|nr:hypothetical protein [Planctomycetota bacterium]